MGDAVRHVRGVLQSLARENWLAVEEKHASNLSRLRDELAQISLSLALKARFGPQPLVVQTPFPSGDFSSCNDVFEAAGPAKKKQKIETRREDAAPPAAAYKEKRMSTRLSMRLRADTKNVDVTGGQKKARKRGRPSDALLRDPGRLKVTELRSELKQRGLKISGLKATLLNRLLDALEEEQKEDEHLQVQEVPEEQEEGANEQKAIVIEDDDEDEIVRESIGSNKSPHSFVASQSMSPKVTRESEAVPTAENEDKDEETQQRASPQASASNDDVVNAGQSSSSKEKQPTALDTAETMAESGSANLKQQEVSTQATGDPTVPSSRHGVDFTAAEGAKELTPHDAIKWMRKSMQISGKSDLTSPIAWKRKSILRKTSSLAPSTRTGRKVSFAPNDKVETIVESSQTDSTQPDPSPEKTPSSNEAHTPREESKPTTSDSLPEADAKPKAVSTPLASSSTVTTPEDPPSRVIPQYETEEQRRKREFDENVQREAQKLRAAAKLSAQKRLEEARASKAFWAKRDQLKEKLRASSAGDKRKSAHTPVVTASEKATDQVSPSTSTAAESTSSATDTKRLTTAASKGETRTEPAIEITREESEESKDHDFMRSMTRRQDVEIISDVSSAFESLLHESKALRSTYSIVEDKEQAECSMSQRAAGNPTARSMPPTVNITKELAQKHSTRLDVEMPRPVQEPSSLSAATAHEDTNKADVRMMHPIEPLFTRDRSDSLSSTVSSIPEPSVVENALKAGTATAANGNRKPIANLVSGLHSFTTLLEKGNSQESNSGRSAPVVNALKLAERSRVAEEKKRVEKERRKAVLKKKMEEHKKTAALKEKAEKDAKAKREQARLHERKKREAELARRRQQKLKEMRAGLEKKRAMLAAEKKSGSSASLVSKSTTTATTASHQHHRGLASASEASQPTAKPISKPVKPISKPMPKPVSSKPAQVLKPAPKLASKSVPRPPMVSPMPTKHAPISHSPEIVNYEMSDNAESSDGDSSDSDTERHGKKKVPRWAQKDHLNKILHAQFGKNAIDPSPAIFQDFVDTCNLEAIFETTDVRKKKKFARRTSSGNWLADRPTARDKALYQHDMGYDR